jgi:hypothetical protein
MAAAEIAGSRVFLALLAYKSRFGAYPKTLHDLKHKLGWKLPVDPFTGEDLIYKPHAHGFLLYSVGLNMKDDGGTPVARRGPEKGDVVWKMER